MTTAALNRDNLAAVVRRAADRLAPSASRPLALLTAPVLLWQGLRIRRELPVLPEASGPRRGVESRGGEDRSEDRGSEEELNLLVLGESTAAGVGVRTQADGLAPALAAELAARTGRPVAWSVVARTGTTARAALRALLPRLDQADLDQEDYDAILVTLGVNDVLRLRSRRAWRRDVAALLDALAGHLRPGGRIVVAGLPDLARFPSLPQPLRTVLALHARGLDRGLAQAAARSPHTVHAPAPPLGGDDFFAADGFHPSGPGYAQWAEALAASWYPRRRAP